MAIAARAPAIPNGPNFENEAHIFADAVTKDFKTPRWICFSKDGKYGKWYAVCNERDENGVRYRTLNIKQ